MTSGRRLLLSALLRQTETELARVVVRKTGFACTRAAISALARGVNSAPSLRLALALRDAIGIGVDKWFQDARVDVDTNAMKVAEDESTTNETPRMVRA
jgi:transcriptional regulator with XRE-family HTH domain